MSEKKNRSGSHNAVPVKPVFREIPAAAIQAKAQAETDAALDELDRCAAEISRVVSDLEMRAILDGLQADLNRAAGSPRMRLRRR